MTVHKNALWVILLAGLSGCSTFSQNPYYQYWQEQAYTMNREAPVTRAAGYSHYQPPVQQAWQPQQYPPHGTAGVVYTQPKSSPYGQMNMPQEVYNYQSRAQHDAPAAYYVQDDPFRSYR